jgi:hypothetical protein
MSPPQQRALAAASRSILYASREASRSRHGGDEMSEAFG